MLQQGDSSPLQPLQQPLDDTTDHASPALPQLQLHSQQQQLQYGSMQQAPDPSSMQLQQGASLLPTMTPAADQNYSNFTSPPHFSLSSAPLYAPSSNPNYASVAPFLTLSDSSSYGSPARSCASPFSPNFVSNPGSPFDVSNMQVPPAGLFNSGTQFAPMNESTFDTSSIQVAPPAFLAPMTQMPATSSFPMNGNSTIGFDGTTAQSWSFNPISSPFSSPAPTPPPPPPPSPAPPQDMNAAIQYLRELEREYEELLNQGPKEAPPPQPVPLESIEVTTLDGPLLSDEQQAPPPIDNQPHSHDFSYTVPSPELFGSMSDLPIERVEQQQSPMQWHQWPSQQERRDGGRYPHLTQPLNNTKIDLWSMSSASQLDFSAPLSGDQSTTYKAESPNRLTELLSGLNDEKDDETWKDKPAAADVTCDDEEDRMFAAPSPYSHVVPSPWVPQNKLLLGSMGPPPPPVRYVAAPSAPAPKPTVDPKSVDPKSVENSFQGEQKQIIMGLLGQIAELKEGKEKEGKEKKKTWLEGTSRWEPSSLGRRTSPSIFQFPARNGREIQFDLCRAMDGFTEQTKTSKSSIGAFVKHILYKVYENPMASLKVTAACERSTKNYRIIPVSSMRTLAKFWMVHFVSSSEHSLARVIDVMTCLVKNFLDKTRSELSRGILPPSSMRT